VGDSGSTRPMRGLASRAVAAVVGVALAAAMAVVPRGAGTLQDTVQVAAPRGGGDAGAASAESTPVERADSSASSLLDADADRDGVPDFMDRCLGTPPGTAVGRDGCAARARLGLLPIAGAAAAFAILLALLLMRIVRRTLRDDAPDLPPLVFNARGRDDDTPTDPRPAASVAPVGAGWSAAAAAPWAGGPRQEPTAAAPHVTPRGAALPEHAFGAPQPAGDVPRGRGLEAPIRPAASAAPPRRAAAAAHGSGESYTELVDARTVRFYRPLDATMQLLPGRLEIVEGAEPGHVIRFVRIPGVPPEITFGRSSGTPPLHVQLLLPTVSRRHARMRYADGGWRIINHSRTNPLVVNGVELVGDGESRTLHDGDRIEMGEVAFVYRER